MRRIVLAAAVLLSLVLSAPAHAQPRLCAPHDARAGGGFIDGYGRSGFLVLGASGHDQTADVELNVVTPRTDAAAYFAARYGDFVKVTVTGDRFECLGAG